MEQKYLSASRIAGRLGVMTGAVQNARSQSVRYKLGLKHRAALMALVEEDQITRAEADRICPVRLNEQAIETLRIMHAEGTFDAEVARLRGLWGAQ